MRFKNAQVIGASCGGRTGKLHALTDDLGRPRVLMLAAGNNADVSLARALVERTGPITKLTADRG